MASSLVRRVQRLESSRGTPGGLGVWASSPWADWDLMQDSTAVLQHCSMDQFVVGRASWVAWDGAQRLLDSFRFWLTYTEPDWYSNAVYLSKPGSVEWVARERAKHPPKDALENFQSFARWSSMEGRSRDHFAIACGIWLIDNLGLTADQVTANGLAHCRAWKFKFDSLAMVTVPEAIALDAPSIPIPGFPVGDWVDKPGIETPIAILDLLMACPSGIRSPHGRIYPGG